MMLKLLLYQCFCTTNMIKSKTVIQTQTKPICLGSMDSFFSLVFFSLRSLILLFNCYRINYSSYFFIFLLLLSFLRKLKIKTHCQYVFFYYFCSSLFGTVNGFIYDPSAILKVL